MKARHLPLLLVPFAVGFSLQDCSPPPQRIAFLSVGQGDCTLLQASGFNLVIDAAPATPQMDSGERLAVPELKRLGVRRIDLLILTHPDADHIGGLRGISKRIPIQRVAYARHFRSHPALVEALSALPSSTERWALDRGEVLRWPGGELVVDFVPLGPGGDDNEGSLTGLIRVGQGTAVFTGDASANVERALASRRSWEAQVLKLGHHGSADSTSDQWLDEVRPLYAVASSGRTNPYGHPSESVRDRLDRAGIPLHRTDQEGTVIFQLGPKGFYRAAP